MGVFSCGWIPLSVIFAYEIFIACSLSCSLSFALVWIGILVVEDELGWDGMSFGVGGSSGGGGLRIHRLDTFCSSWL